MIFYVPNDNEISRFVELISVTKNTQSSVKLTLKNNALAGLHGATKCINCMDLIRKNKREKL